MALTEWHRRFAGSVQWRLTPQGVEIDGSGVERTKGAPVTATRIWERYGAHVNRIARERRVPCALIVATIATESGGDPSAVRMEPGWRSDEETPGRVSAGLMQTLISTAREAMQMSFGRDWLLDPGNSIEAGTAYIAAQFRLTGFDPPLVAAAYNAGRIVEQPGAENRWKLRQYPIGTGRHCDRFVRFFNDAVAALASSSVRPSVGLDALLGETPRAPVGSSPGATPTRDQPVVRFAERANAADVTPYSLQVLVDTLRAARLAGALVSSTARGPRDQARVMYDNLQRQGVEEQRRLYGPYGDKVIDVYVAAKAAGRSPDEIRAAMEAKIIDLGPTNVSKHASDPKLYNVFDVAPSSITDRAAFEGALRAERDAGRIAKFLTPSDSDPGYHLEIPQPRR
jgi:hypothetical protein